MKKILNLVLLFGVMACGLAACSDDDDDDKLSGVIDSIEIQIEGETVATQKFTYDEKERLIKVTEPAFGEDGVGEVSYTFTYEENKVTVVFAEGVNDRDSETCEFELEGDKAISYKNTSRWGTIEGEFVYEGNKLQKWIEDEESTEFTWEDGNITFIDDEEDFGGKVSSYENKANIDYNAILSAFPDELSGAAYAGILGEKTKNVIFPEGNNYNVTLKDGYITEISFTEEEDEVSFTTTLKFNYK